MKELKNLTDAEAIKIATIIKPDIKWSVVRDAEIVDEDDEIALIPENTIINKDKPEATDIKYAVQIIINNKLDLEEGQSIFNLIERKNADEIGDIEFLEIPDEKLNEINEYLITLDYTGV